MPEGIRKINVIGHLHPDTDSVCSAIAYAHLKNEVEHTNIYEARRAGDVEVPLEVPLYVVHRVVETLDPAHGVTVLPR